MPTDDRLWDARLIEDRPDLLKWTDKALRGIFESRAISDEVWRARPYIPYHAGEWEAVVAAEPGYAAEELAAPTRRKVAQRPGLVMRREGYGSSRHQLAQLRPFRFKELDPSLDLAAYGVTSDAGVLTRREYWHDHESPEWHEHDGDRIVPVDGPDAHLRMGDPSKMPVSNLSRRRNRSRDLGEHIDRAHHGDAPPDGVVHSHKPPQAAVAAHVAKDHRGVPQRGRHIHEKRAKYLYPPGDEPFRIDIHPMSWPLLEGGGDVVFFAMEGLLKADAILSAGGAVINCGSVTLWPDPVLPELAEAYLSRFALVVVVPDSDWHGNKQVETQASKLAEALRRHDLQAVVAAPPPDPSRCGGLVCEHLTRDVGPGRDPLPDASHKLGVDDFLGFGGRLDDMVALVRREMSTPPLPRRRVDQVERDTAVLDHLMRTASMDGVVLTTFVQLGEAVGWSRGTAGEALKSLERAGVLKFVDSTRWVAAQPPKRAMTAIQLAPEYRPHVDFMRLGDYRRWVAPPS